MRKAEKLLLSLFFIGLIFKLFHLPGASPILIISLSGLSFFYFYFGILLFNNRKLSGFLKRTSYNGLSPKRILASLALGFSLSVLSIGSLFKIEIWPGSSTMVMLGLLVLIVFFVVLSISNKGFDKSVYTRALIIGGLSFCINWIPTDTQIDFYYRDNPQLAELMKALQKDPGNETLHKKIDEEFNKLEE